MRALLSLIAAPASSATVSTPKETSATLGTAADVPVPPAVIGPGDRGAGIQRDLVRHIDDRCSHLARRRGIHRSLTTHRQDQQNGDHERADCRQGHRDQHADQQSLGPDISLLLVISQQIGPLFTRKTRPGDERFTQSRRHPDYRRG
jgi:hypothetical protein